MVSLLLEFYDSLEEKLFKTFDLLVSPTMVFQILIKCGPKEFLATIDVSNDNNINPSNNHESIKPLKTIGELRRFIAQQLNCDSTSMKIIYKGICIRKGLIIFIGKFIGTGDENEMLSVYGFKAKDKLMVISGSPPSNSSTTNKKPQKQAGGLIKEDPGYKALCEYEKNKLIPLNQQFEKNDKEIAELERNFLEGEQRKEMIVRMDKQLRLFTELCIRHMESIDGIDIYGDKNDENSSIPESQRQKNREKRKFLINGIQDLMNRNDKYLFRLNQYQYQNEHPDEGH